MLRRNSLPCRLSTDHDSDSRDTLPIAGTDQHIMFKQRNREQENREQITKVSGCRKRTSIKHAVWGVNNFRRCNLGLFEGKRVGE